MVLERIRASAVDDRAPASDHEPRKRRPQTSAAVGPGRAAITGFVAGASGIAAGELLAGTLPGLPSPVIAVGTLVIKLQPPWAKDVVVGLFGTNDKLALNIAVLLAGLLVASLIGLVGRRSYAWAVGAFSVFGGISLVGAVNAELVPLPAALIASAITVVVASSALWLLSPDATRRGVVRMRGAASRADGEGAADPFRRQFLIRSLTILAGAVLAGSLGRYLLNRAHPAGSPVSATLPKAGSTVAPLNSDVQLSAPGLTPLVTANSDFYRIDTSLLVSQIDASTWQLKISGMVDHPRTYSYADLRAMPQIEQYVTLACVSNTVGGNLVGNALWTGARLKEILAAAGVQAGATQIVGRSIDGFTVGFPTSWAMDPSREPMVALGMNREPLPAEHGYPARLIVPGLYGYVSATKWLGELELTTREKFDGSWVQFGWYKDGPILTESRIDHPADEAKLPAGPTWIDGMAWAPDRGIIRVEVRIDNGPWSQAEISRAISKATWVQWMWLWQADSGDHAIEARATDGTGEVQTSTFTQANPGAATGYPSIKVTVT